ncbi:MAG: TIGR00730 family Rossman fold protein [Bacteroidales bacterium]|nr:TIGR00730 family Rossman fold protein [Bacteroidales bacterium]
MNTIRRITIYCASSRAIDQKYYDATKRLAKVLVENNITAVYGGGAVGLMGALADYMLEHKGKIEGVIPKFMLKVEWGHKKVKKMTVVKDMHERKKLLIKKVDAVIALPGGTGTVEELLEVISLKRLGKFTKPILILNTDGYYNSLIDLFDKMVQEKFIRKDHTTMWTVINQPDELMHSIHNAALWDEDAINIASV